MTKPVYIQRASSIAAEVTEPLTNRLAAAEPDYGTLIEPRQLRRMSRIMRMGVAAAKQCLQDAVPGAITTGTAYGCLEDTGIFLREVIERREQLPPPTAFIQSTHNTVGAQVALMLKCHGYNNTFVHRGFSFEHALQDAMLLLLEEETKTVLTGAVDELTDNSFAILQRFDKYKPASWQHNDLYDGTEGTVAGEGASFFLLSRETNANTLARIEAMDMLYKPADTDIVISWIADFLSRQAVNTNDIDLLLTGNNGDSREHLYATAVERLFPSVPNAWFKHLCGEYPTANAFGLHTAVSLVSGKVTIDRLRLAGKRPSALKRILLYNHYQQTHHSLILLSAI